MNQYYVDKDYIHFKGGYDKDFIESVKFLGAGYNSELKKWYVPNSIKTSTKIAFLIKKFGFSKIKKEDLKEFQFDKFFGSKTVVDRDDYSIEEIKELAEWFDFKLTPRPYQLEGIKHMLDFKKTINGSEPGTGKTGMSICAVEIQDLFPCLIICPSNVKYNWQKEYSRWVQEPLEIKIIEAGKNEEFSKTGISIINYEMLYERGDKNNPGYDQKEAKIKFRDLQKIPWRCVVVDESHRARNNKSKTSKIIRRITKKIPYVFLLTGTPILKKPEQILNQLQILGVFKTVFQSWETFIQRFCDGVRGERGWVKNGFSNLSELNGRLRANCYFRVEKKDVLKELPDVIISEVYIPISNEKQYVKAEKKILDHLLETKGEDAVLNAQDALHLVQRTELRQLTHKGKIKALTEWMEDYLETTDENIVVVGNFKDGLGKISKKFDAQLINGDVSAKKKQDIIDDVISNDDRVVVGNIKSMGTGTDGLQIKYSTIILLDAADDPGEEDQVISRLDRSGQKRKVSVYKFIAENTIDIEKNEVMSIEKKISDMVNRGRVMEQNVNIYNGIKESISKRIK